MKESSSRVLADNLSWQSVPTGGDYSFSEIRQLTYLLKVGRHLQISKCIAMFFFHYKTQIPAGKTLLILIVNPVCVLQGFGFLRGFIPSIRSLSGKYVRFGVINPSVFFFYLIG